jgi:hypothetical protein
MLLLHYIIVLKSTVHFKIVPKLVQKDIFKDASFLTNYKDVIATQPVE